MSLRVWGTNRVANCAAILIPEGQSTLFRVYRAGQIKPLQAVTYLGDAGFQFTQTPSTLTEHFAVVFSLFWYLSWATACNTFHSIFVLLKNIFSLQEFRMNATRAKIVRGQHTDNIQNSLVEHNLSWEADSFSVSQEISTSLRFIAIYTRAQNVSECRARKIPSKLSHPVHATSISVISDLRLGLPSGLLPSDLPTKIL